MRGLVVVARAFRPRATGGSPRLALTLCALVTLAPACGSRTGLADEPWSPDGLACQELPYRARPGVALALYASLPRGGHGRARWEVTSGPAGAAPEVVHAGGTSATFRASAEGVYEVRVTAPGDGNDGGAAEASCTMRVIVRAEGVVALCPAELTTAPLRPVQVRGGARGDRPVASYAWTLERAPATSARPELRPDDRAVTGLTPDVAGEYALRLRVTDVAGASDSCVTRVRAVPSEGLRVELVWDPPGRACPSEPGAACDGSDVDLHVLREAGRAGAWRSNDDCHWFNCNAAASRALAWGMPGAADDPRLDLDDVTGHGPENVNVDRPSAPAYRVGVHYFDAHGAGPQAATVLVYCGGAEPAARLGPVTLSYRGSADASDFWFVADVLPRGASGCDVRPLPRGADPWIVSYADAQRGDGPPPP